MSDFEVATSRAGEELADLMKIFESIAIKNPDDREAQGRVDAAGAFYNSVSGFLRRSVDKSPEESPPFTKSSPTIQNNQLPTEIFQLIVNNVVNLDYETRQQTMGSLSASSRMLRAIAEPYIYTHPRDLDTIERQWKFAFTLAAEPHLCRLVRSLRVLWLSTGENGRLLVDIAAACSNNKKLLVQRGEGLEDSNTILNEDVLEMAALLEASPPVTDFSYSTYVKWSREEERYGNTTREEILTLCQKEVRFARFASNLAHLTLHGQVQWLLQALIPHVSSRLTSLTLGQDTDLAFNSQFFAELARQSPYLEELEVRCQIDSPMDLANACTIWGSTLRALRLSVVNDATEWIPQVMTSLGALTELSLGPGCYMSIRDLGAIARVTSEQGLVFVSLDDLQDPDDALDVDAAKAELDEHLVSIIRSHSSTLEHLQINLGRRTRVGRRVLHTCKGASRLKSLYLAPPSDAEPSDIDDLLQTCIELSDLTTDLQNCSACPQVWEARYHAKEKQDEEELMREGPIPGLGT